MGRLLQAALLGCSIAACGSFPGTDVPEGSAAGSTSSAAGSSAGGAPSTSHAGQANVGGALAGAPTGQGGAPQTGGGTGAAGNAAGAPSAGAAGATPLGSTIAHVTFDDTALGKYNLSEVATEWGGRPPWENGLADGRADIVGGTDAYMGHSLRVTYPANVFGPENGGVQFIVPLPKSYTELYCMYRVRFDADFDFVKGGKLPGLSGGTNDTGGTKPNGSDGWSGRMMWREAAGNAVQYVYYPDQASTFADDFPWSLGGQVSFGKGKWHTVEHHIVMNTPGSHDGLVEGWFDGKPALKHGSLRFRDTTKFAIDDFYFSTFYGGSDQAWAPTAEHHAYFDDFVIADHPLH